MEKTKVKKSKIGRKVKHFLKTFDQYGHPVTLQYKNDSHYRTPFGGIVSILTIIGLFIWFAILLK